MKVKEMIEALQRFNENMELVYKSESILLDCTYPEIVIDKDNDYKKVILIGI